MRRRGAMDAVAAAGPSTAAETSPSPTPAAQGTIDIVTRPPGASISVNGSARGRSPLRGVVLPPDREYTIRAELDGHQAFSSRVMVRPGRNPALTVQLQAVAAATPAPEVASAEPMEEAMRRRDLRVPPNVSGNAGRGQGLLSTCQSCHSVNARARTATQWSRYFQSGRHGRHAMLRDSFTAGQLADVKAYLMAHAADVQGAMAAGVH